MKFADYCTMFQEEEEQDLLLEMARVGSKHHGIEDVIIWVGETNKRHSLRIKVSKFQNKWVLGEYFIIQMPSLDYDPDQIPKWITVKKLEQIFDWIKLNQKLLSDYENGKIDITSEFLKQIAKVSK